MVAFPFLDLMEYLLLPVLQSPPRDAPSCVLSNPPYLYSIYLNIPRMTFLFHRLIQSKRNPLRYIFALLGNTRGSTPITHISHKYYWTTESSSLLAPSSLMMGNSPLIVSRNVPNEPIIYSTGTALEGGWTLWINPDARNTTQGIFLGYISKMEAHLACWYNYSFSPLLIQIVRMLAPTTCHPAPYLDALI